MIDLEKEINEKLHSYASMKPMALLNSLTFAESTMSITELADNTGLSPSTVHRILQEMLECGWVMKTADKKYKLGYEAFSMAVRVKSKNYLLEASVGEMIRLNDLSCETVHLIVLDGYEGMYVAKQEAKNQIGLRSRVGKHIPLYCTGGGKAIMSSQEDSWLKDYLRSVERKQFTPATKTTEQELWQEVKLIRHQGYSLDIREHNPDIICVAAPIVDGTGRAVCAISVSAPDYRFTVELARSLSGEVAAAAQTISAKLKK